MIKSAARRLSIAVALATFPLAVTGMAQTASAPKGTARPAGVTGTDPVPPGCGCKVVSSPTTSTATTSSAPVAENTSVVHTLLVWLGMA